MTAVALGLATFLAASGSAHAEPVAHDYPDGRVEIVPFFGRIDFDRKFGLQSGIVYGGEVASNFRFGHPWAVVGIYTRIYGAQSAFVGTDDDVDVINASAGATFAARFHVGSTPLLPYVRGGAGFLLADGTPGGFDLRGRVAYEVAGGAKLYPFGWLVVRAELGLLMHDNLPLGAVSGQLGNDIHWFPTIGVGFIR